MLIVQLSDLHLCPPGQLALRVVDTIALARAAVSTVKALPVRPDFLVISGDLTESGLPEEYRLLREMLDDLGLPLLIVPGNHDHRETLRAELDLGPHAVTEGGFVQFLADIGDLRLIGLDTVEPGASAGALCKARLDFLDRALTEAEGREVLLFMHHPPFSCALPYMDGVMLRRGAGELAEIVSRHNNVRRLFCGHHHRPIQTRFAGTFAQVAPGIAHQVRLDLSADAVPMFMLEPPGFLLHMRQGSEIVTHTLYTGAYSGPYPFRPQD